MSPSMAASEAAVAAAEKALRCEQSRLHPVAAAARVLTAHYPKPDRHTCYCGQEWHPRHQAEALAEAGLIRMDA